MQIKELKPHHTTEPTSNHPIQHTNKSGITSAIHPSPHLHPPIHHELKQFPPQQH